MERSKLPSLHDRPEFRRGVFLRQGEEALCHAPVKPRMLEICEFAHKMGYRRLGLAFCGGLPKEAAIVDEILKGHGFETVSVVCKAGEYPRKRSA